MNLENVPLSLRACVTDAILELAGQDEDSIRVCTELVETAAFVSAQFPAGIIGPIYYLDDLGIRDGDIYRLYKMCRNNIADMLALLRGVKQGIISREVLVSAIANNGEGINLGALICKAY